MKIIVSAALGAALVTGAGAAWGDTFTNVGLSIRLASPTQVEIGWDTATNAGYRLEYCSTLTTGAWTQVCWLPGDGNRCCTNDTLLPSQPTYYRVAVTPAPTSWKKLFGGGLNDYANSVEPTSDGGYIVGGSVQSSDDDASGNHGQNDGFVLKLDQNGAVQWRRCLGGTNNESILSVQQTSDGGFIAAGYSNSHDGDVSGNHGALDAWLVKLATNGVIQWQKCFGGAAEDGFSSVQQTDDGGYLAAGYTSSTNGNVSGNHGWQDAWVVKTDPLGNLQWQKCLGGTNYDGASQIQQTSDGGYVFAGVTYSNDGAVLGNHGDEDGWVVKLNTNGVVQWQRVIGGSDYDEFWSVRQTRDGGYITAGVVNSYDGDISRTNGGSDCWVVKLDANGNTQWQKTIGGNNDETFTCICQTSDGGYIATGYGWSSDGQVSGQHGEIDVYVFKLDAMGETQWQRCLGGSNSDLGGGVEQSQDGGYVVTCETISTDGDVDPSHTHGSFDIWVIKLLPNGQ